MRRGGGESGSTTVELAVVVPAALFLVMLVIQFALWQHAAHVAAAAAHAGARAAQGERASAASGRAEARAFLEATAPALLTDVTVEAQRTVANARVVVRASAPAVVPGFRWPVTGTAEGPVERFRGRQER